jgi:hypothetical protein
MFVNPGIEVRFVEAPALIKSAPRNPIAGRIQDDPISDQTAVVLPCNEYFDDKCASDTRSALGAYVSSALLGGSRTFEPCQDRVCKAIGSSSSTAENRSRLRFELWSGTRPPYARSARLIGTDWSIVESFFVFESACELVTCLADELLSHIVTPILGKGHGGMDSSTAFVILVLALAGAVRSVPSLPLRSATIFNFKRDEESSTKVDPVVVRRALALTAATRHGKGGK